jgi:hypothetical protein
MPLDGPCQQDTNQPTGANDMTNSTTNPLAFLNDSTQYDFQRLTCQETTVRVLLAILYQANASDSEEASEWQTTKHMEIYSHVSKILDIMGMTHIHDQMCNNGQVDFSTPDKPWVTPAEQLESLEGQLREAQWDFDQWLESDEADAMNEDKYEDLYWDKTARIDTLNEQVLELASSL